MPAERLEVSSNVCAHKVIEEDLDSGHPHRRSHSMPAESLGLVQTFLFYHKQ